MLLELEPEELAGFVLQYLASVSPTSGLLHRGNFSLGSTVADYPSEKREAVGRALMEAWVWLEREGLIAPRPGQQGDWVFITRRGRQAASPEALSAYRRANVLPRQLLHPSIGQKVWATFLRGDYDTAVFQAFKEVEVAVRDGAALLPSDIGVHLMRKAFDPERGPLTDPNALPAERDALANLFAGAIGSYKNPHSHRAVTIDASQAVEMIILASHLLSIVDKRRPAPDHAV
jgi:uncharacterized protein (TIGR02391 family)